MPADSRGGASAPRLMVVDLEAASANWSLPDSAAERLRSESPPGWRLHFVTQPTISDGDGAEQPSADALAAIAEAEAYAGFGIPRTLFLAARRLRWVHSAAAGVGKALFPEMVSSDVLFTNSAGVHAVPIAEHVLGGVLNLLRGFDIASDQQRVSRWDKGPFVEASSPVRELGDCRVLIVGTGGLGSAVAERMVAFGARCTGVRRRTWLGAPRPFERVIPLEAVDDELPHADIIVLTAALTEQTRGLLSAERMRRLPRNAIVVNVARGAMLDEDALASLVGAGALRGAVLDVFDREPLAQTSPLWQLRSVLITPHVSAVSPLGYWRRELALLLDNWHRYHSGEPLLNLVDKRAGY